ncbi:hypothetical protein [Mucilaginibacter psychrotolerans]|uniref:Uncharacterized protein n=1 Tax=Mucilaginibacter psychrotolerans TaxID=1524096 RepID=A0A4Y8S5L9_9SPHI|nr:hypothetical protein [Mucilaginibacter psychrotolerans]TFF33905.1 hypothetical protein E2R66_23800 [Mucilaginibacter psychrotolerans]
MKDTLDGSGYPVTGLTIGVNNWSSEGFESILESAVEQLCKDDFRCLKQPIDFFKFLAEQFKKEFELIDPRKQH